MTDDLLKISCTTHIICTNKKTGKVYKDEEEMKADVASTQTETTMDHIKQDITVEVSPKGLQALQKVMARQNAKKS